jgi:hypothetical protein
LSDSGCFQASTILPTLNKLNINYLKSHKSQSSDDTYGSVDAPFLAGSDFLFYTTALAFSLAASLARFFFSLSVNSLTTT